MVELIIDELVKIAVTAICAFVAPFLAVLVAKITNEYIRRMSLARAAGKNQLMLDTIEDTVQGFFDMYNGNEESIIKKSHAVVREYVDRFKIPLKDDQIDLLIHTALFAIKEGLKGDVS